MLQKLATAAVASGCSASDLAQVAGLGHAGAHQGNIHRDLLRCYVPQWATPHPHTVLCETIVRNGDGESMAVTEQAALLPSDWVRVLHERGLADDLLGTRQQREAFWASQADSPKMCGVGYYHLDFEPGDTVPLLLFSDGARHAEQDSITTASFRSLLAHDLDVAQSMFMLCAVPKSATVKHKTWEAIWQVLTADLNCLAQGRGLDGQPTPLKAVVWVVAGDYEHMVLEYGLPHWASFKCFWCSAEKDHFFDFPTIPSSAYSPEDMLDQPPLTHPLAGLTTYSPALFAIDTLHCVDLGVAEHVYGNLLWELTESWPGTKQHRLARLNKELREAYSACGVAPCRVLRREDFQPPPGGYPRLRHLKAAVVRHMAPAAAHLARRYGRGGPSCKKRAEAVSLLRDLYTAIEDRTHYKWRKKVHEQFVSDLQKFMRVYTELGILHGPGRWHKVFKFHMLCHLPSQGKCLAPRFAWTYAGETFMSLATQLAASSVRGTPPRLLGPKITQKYRAAMHLMLAGIIPLRTHLLDEPAQD